MDTGFPDTHTLLSVLYVCVCNHGDVGSNHWRVTGSSGSCGGRNTDLHWDCAWCKHVNLRLLQHDYLVMCCVFDDTWCVHHLPGNHMNNVKTYSRIKLISSGFDCQAFACSPCPCVVKDMFTWLATLNYLMGVNVSVWDTVCLYMSVLWNTGDLSKCRSSHSSCVRGDRVESPRPYTGTDHWWMDH